MAGRKPRKLRPDEVDLWARVTETATPLSEQARSETSPLALEKPLPEARRPTVDLAPLDRRPPPPDNPQSPRVIRQPDVSDALRDAPVQMDGKTFRKMARGKLKPDARIDLHGLTLQAAHARLDAFIRNAHFHGKRLVLVITGKGKDRDDGGPIPTRRGVLRNQVPHWLNTPAMSPLILQITPASRNYGGDGAYFVYLRKRR